MKPGILMVWVVGLLKSMYGLVQGTTALVSPLITNLDLGGFWTRNHPGESRRTTTQTVTDSSTFVADNTLTATLSAGRQYRFRLRYWFTTVATSGVKVDLSGGTGTVSAINGTAKLYSLVAGAGTLLSAEQITALATVVGITLTTTISYMEIDGTMLCTAASGAGTFIPRFAQNLEGAPAESVIAQIGSFMELSDVG